MMSPPSMMPNEEMRPHSVAFGTPMYPMMNFQWKPMHSNPPPDVTTGGAPLGVSQPNISGLLFRPDVISDQPVSCSRKNIARLQIFIFQKSNTFSSINIYRYFFSII